MVGEEPSLRNGHKCGAWVTICSPSSVIVSSSYEWKILEWDEKLQTNKQTNSQNPIQYKFHIWSYS